MEGKGKNKKGMKRKRLIWMPEKQRSEIKKQKAKRKSHEIDGRQLLPSPFPLPCQYQTSAAAGADDEQGASDGYCAEFLQQAQKTRPDPDDHPPGLGPDRKGRPYPLAFYGRNDPGRRSRRHPPASESHQLAQIQGDLHRAIGLHRRHRSHHHRGIQRGWNRRLALFPRRSLGGGDARKDPAVHQGPGRHGPKDGFENHLPSRP